MKLKFNCDGAALRRIKECAQAAKTFDCGELELFGLKQAVITKVNHTAIAENLFQTEVELVAYFKPKKLPFTPDIQYLINLDTKEHTLWDGEYPGPGNWQTVEADEDGFIRHDAKNDISPIKTDQKVKYILQDGTEDSDFAGLVSWADHGPRTILAYRPIFDKAKASNKNYDETESVLTDDMPTIKEMERLRRNTNIGAYGQATLDSATTNELIDRLEAAHAASVEFPDLVEQLRSRLAKIGLFVGYGGFDWANPEESEDDLTDWRNWKNGDKVKCVASGDIYFNVGSKYKVEDLQGALYITDERGGRRLLEGNAYRFELFSKPKG